MYECNMLHAFLLGLLVMGGISLASIRFCMTKINKERERSINRGEGDNVEL